jgi:hypothetical protein
VCEEISRETDGWPRTIRIYVYRQTNKTEMEGEMQRKTNRSIRRRKHIKSRIDFSPISPSRIKHRRRTMRLKAVFKSHLPRLAALQYLHPEPPDLIWYAPRIPLEIVHRRRQVLNRLQ